MAQAKPEFVTLKEFRDIADQLLKKYPDKLEGIDVKEVTCVAITNKEPKTVKPEYEIKPVPFPIRLDCPYGYYIVVNGQQWDTMGAKAKPVLVLKALSQLSREGDGKVVPLDLKDQHFLVKKLGVDYLTNPDIPDILNDNVDWDE